MEVPCPSTFDFVAEHWSQWKQRFLRFRSASELSTKGEQRQVNMLLYCMGERSEDILTSFNLSDDDAKKFNTVLRKFDDFFGVQKNLVFEYAQFSKRKQLPGECATDYITAVFKLAETCEFGELRERLIMCQLAVGISDEGLSMRLQRDKTLTLDKAITEIKQEEQVKGQQGKLRGSEGNTTEVNVIRQQLQPHRAHATTNGRHYASPQQQRPSAYNSSTCKWCGKHPHKRINCPAKDATCDFCSKKGHFSRVCMSTGKVKATTVHDVEAEASAIFIDTLDANNSEPWYDTVTVDGVDIRFKLDSGADVTCIPASVYVKLIRPRDLQKTNRLLYGANNSPLTVMGIFTAHLAWRQNVCTTEVYIINDLRTSLLSRGACEALGLLIRAEEVAAVPDDIRAQYPQLFTGIGCMAEPHEIRIRPDAKPFALHAPRRVPLPLMAQVKTELEKLQQQGIIERVDTPTDWCAPMVVVPKRSGSLRLCVDLTRLNDAVMRERHMLPAVDQTLAMLTGATVFSKLDCNSSFFQIPLTPACMKLTTFITPFGRFCFRRLPQGLSSASEEFQKRSYPWQKRRQKTARHRAKAHTPFTPGQRVWVPDLNAEGRIIQALPYRAYQIRMLNDNVVRRNARSIRCALPARNQLSVIPYDAPTTPRAPARAPSSHPLPPRSSGRPTKKPQRLDL
jgi:hypothetical protein